MSQTAVAVTVIVVIAVIVVYVALQMRRGKKLDALTPILVEERNPDKYIERVSALMEKTRSSQFRQVLLLNLAAAYCDKRDHGKAHELLTQIKPGQLSLANRTVYWANLALTCFYLGDKEKACQIVEKQKADFQKPISQENIGPTLALVAIFYEQTKGSRKEARELYARARRKWYNDRYAADFDYLGKYFEKRA